MARDRVIVSPVIPTVAVLLLAALWGLSVFAGWGLEAFCADGESSAECVRRLETAATFSRVFAVIAGCVAVYGWLAAPEHRFLSVMGVSAVAWVAAVATLFVGGTLAQ